MADLWFHYEKTQLRLGQQFETEHPEVVPRTKLEEIWAWEDFAMGEFVKWISEPAVEQVR